MNFNKTEDSLQEKLIEAIEELYVDVKIKYKCDDEEEFKNNELEKIKDINVFKLIDYIKESINIYVNFKVDEARNSTNESNDKQKIHDTNDEEAYEKMIKKLEADVRNHIKVEYELKLQNEYLESKLEEYENILAEMEKLQTKIDHYERKLCSQEFLEMNKKENEILILRAENSNLKNTISITEKNLERLQLKFSEYKSNKDKIIMKNQEIIHKLTKKLKKIEESSLMDNLTNCTSDKNENSNKVISLSKNKEKFSTITAQTSRKNSGTNILNMFHSDGKGKQTERKYSINELMIFSDNLNQRALIDNFIGKESSCEKVNESSAGKSNKITINKQRAYSNIFEKINNNVKIHQNEKINKKPSTEKNNFKRSSSVNDFNPNGTCSISNTNINIINNSNNSNSNNNTNHQLSKSDLKEKNEKTKISIGYDIKSNPNNIGKNVASQMYKKNNSNNNSANINNFNHITKSNDLNKTPVSGNSYNSINFNNNNIIINNKYESDASKPITNLNMIFKFKTILSDEVNSKKNKIIKVDTKKVVKANNSKTKNPNNSEKNSKNLGNTLSNENPLDNYKSQNSILNLIENKGFNIDSHNTINFYNNTLKKKNDADMSNQKKKILNMNSTLKGGNSSSKSKVKSSKVNECKSNFDALKYSINQLKDYLNPQNQTNPQNRKSKSRSKGKVSNMGII